jgi:hypothetical protein
MPPGANCILSSFGTSNCATPRSIISGEDIPYTYTNRVDLMDQSWCSPTSQIDARIYKVERQPSSIPVPLRCPSLRADNFGSRQPPSKKLRSCHILLLTDGRRCSVQCTPLVGQPRIYILLDQRIPAISGRPQILQRTEL